MSIVELLSQSLINYDGDPPKPGPHVPARAGVEIEWNPPMVEDEWTLAARAALEKFLETHEGPLAPGKQLVKEDILAAVRRISCTCAYDDSEEMASYAHLCVVLNTHKHQGSI